MLLDQPFSMDFSERDIRSKEVVGAIKHRYFAQKIALQPGSGLPMSLDRRGVSMVTLLFLVLFFAGPSAQRRIGRTHSAIDTGVEKAVPLRIAIETDVTHGLSLASDIKQ